MCNTPRTHTGPTAYVTAPHDLPENLSPDRPCKTTLTYTVKDFTLPQDSHIAPSRCCGTWKYWPIHHQTNTTPYNIQVKTTCMYHATCIIQNVYTKHSKPHIQQISLCNADACHDSCWLPDYPFLSLSASTFRLYVRLVHLAFLLQGLLTSCSYYSWV